MEGGMGDWEGDGQWRGGGEDNGGWCGRLERVGRGGVEERGTDKGDEAFRTTHQPLNTVQTPKGWTTKVASEEERVVRGRGTKKHDVEDWKG